MARREKKSVQVGQSARQNDDQRYLPDDRVEDWTILGPGPRLSTYWCRCRCGHVQWAWKCDLGIGKLPRCRHCTKKQRNARRNARIQELLDQGASILAIARDLGCSRQWMDVLVKQLRADGTISVRRNRT